MAQLGQQREADVELRRHPRYRVSAPFPCAFSLLGLKRWTASERNGLGVVVDVSLKGAKVMSTAAMSPGDHLAVSFRMPDQVTAMQLDAIVRWINDQLIGLEFVSMTISAETRLKKFLARSSHPYA
ncbi:MAG TPA: PilZ domain-containing protein [Nitrospira sp.]|nr:PilZ domain-containing protein [Nitrospira sp.]HET9961830.1 PilZ domain-containing protein [Nitrospiraceae bacterium]HEU4504212.1 PilZ domain-containing protein [Nitrospira sp.]